VVDGDFLSAEIAKLYLVAVTTGACKLNKCSLRRKKIASPYKFVSRTENESLRYVNLKIAEFQMNIDSVVDIDESGILSHAEPEFLLVSPLVSVLYAWFFFLNIFDENKRGGILRFECVPADRQEKLLIYS